MIKYKACKWRTRLRLKHYIYRLNIIFRSLNFFSRITSKSPSSHTIHLFLSLPASHLRPFSALSDTALIPINMKVKKTGCNRDVAGKVCFKIQKILKISIAQSEKFPRMLYTEKGTGGKRFEERAKNYARPAYYLFDYINMDYFT